MRILLPTSILCCALLFVWWLLSSNHLERGRNTPNSLKKHVVSGEDALQLPFVSTKTFALQLWQIPVTASGVVAPVSQVSVLAEVDGQIRRIHPHFKTNEVIAKGEVLFELYSPKVNAQVAGAQSKLQQARQQLAQTKAQLTSAGEVPGLETPQQYRQGVLQAQYALLKAARAELGLAQEQAAGQKIVADFDARVLEQGFSPGQLVRAGTELAQIFAPDKMSITIGLSRANASLLRQSSRTTAQLPVVIARAVGNTYDYFEGELQSRQGVINAATGTEDLTIKVTSEAHQAQLMPGERVDVRILVDLAQPTLRVPHAFIHENQLLGVLPQHQSNTGQVIRYPFQLIMQDRRFVYLTLESDNDEDVVLIQNTPSWLLPGHRVRMSPGNQFNGETNKAHKKMSLQGVSQLERGA